MSPDGSMPAPRVVERLVTAYDMLGYDIGHMGDIEAQNLTHMGIKSEPVRQTAKDAPFSVLKTATGDKIGFVRFPSLPPGEDIPSERMVKSLSRQMAQQRDVVRLVVALSDWGWVGEREYLARRPDVVPDILLGSGRGSGVNGRIEAGGRCVWVRPYDKGQTVSEVVIQAWPERTAGFRWTEPDAIMPRTIGLGDQYEDNPDVAAVLR
jgi:hypothetical protein